MCPAPDAQPDLFGEPGASRRRRGPSRAGASPAATDEACGALAARLPPGVRLGTSSWSFPGWRGLVYGGDHTEAALARDGLWAYARHPLLRAVGDPARRALGETLGVMLFQFPPMPPQVWLRRAPLSVVELARGLAARG
jgi:hypothetical protein